jgi:hypothetical protein
VPHHSYLDMTDTLTAGQAEVTLRAARGTTDEDGHDGNAELSRDR